MFSGVRKIAGGFASGIKSVVLKNDLFSVIFDLNSEKPKNITYPPR
jgi:hypothetical protein